MLQALSGPPLLLWRPPIVLATAMHCRMQDACNACPVPGVMHVVLLLDDVTVTGSCWSGGVLDAAGREHHHPLPAESAHRAALGEPASSLLLSLQATSAPDASMAATAPCACGPPLQAMRPCMRPCHAAAAQCCCMRAAKHAHSSSELCRAALGTTCKHGQTLDRRLILAPPHTYCRAPTRRWARSARWRTGATRRLSPRSPRRPRSASMCTRA